MQTVKLEYPLARQGVFTTIQGEGALLGTPMVFVRLAGCSVGCPQCDTDYRVAARWTAKEIAERASIFGLDWTWVTGGEPTDHDLGPLLEQLRCVGHVALATSGVNRFGFSGHLLDFLSVSPHGKPSDLVIRNGSQINLVPGLNGLKLSEWDDFSTVGFDHCFVTPLHGNPDSLNECSWFVSRNQKWRLGIQAHRVWGIP